MDQKKFEGLDFSNDPKYRYDKKEKSQVAGKKFSYGCACTLYALSAVLGDEKRPPLALHLEAQEKGGQYDLGSWIWNDRIKSGFSCKAKVNTGQKITDVIMGITGKNGEFKFIADGGGHTIAISCKKTSGTGKQNAYAPTEWGVVDTNDVGRHDDTGKAVPNFIERNEAKINGSIDCPVYLWSNK